MKISVQFYAQLRDLAGASELNVDLPDKATIGDLLARIYEEMPALRSQTKAFSSVRAWSLLIAITS